MRLGPYWAIYMWTSELDIPDLLSTYDTTVYVLQSCRVSFAQLEELVSPTPLLVFPVTPLARLEKLGFLALNTPKLPPIGLKF